MREKLTSTKSIWIDLIFIIIGNIIYGVGVNMFTAPNDIAPGGLTGLATVLNSWLGMPIGIGIFILNVPLFVIAFFKFKKEFIIKTFIAMLFMSVFCDALTFLPPYTGDMMVASIFGGGLTGIGLGIIFVRGIVTGGTDLLGKIVKLRFPHISLGTLLMIIDFIVVFIAGIYYRDMKYALYPIVTIFISTIVINKMIDGLDIARVAFIVSKVPEEISQAVIEKLDRTTTILKGRGGYNKEEMEVIMCTVKIQQLPKLKKIVSEIDPKAFMVVNTASEVLGEGFKEYGNDI